MRKIPPNKIIVLGRGLEALEVGSETNHCPTRQTVSRAAAAGRYFQDNIGWFAEPDALIVCSGSHPGSSTGMSKPEQVSEGQFMKDILVNDFDVPPSKVEVEANSSSTLTNFSEILKAGHFAVDQFNAEDPLGLVASLPHGIRAKQVARRAFGINDRDGITIIGGAREISPFTALEEGKAYVATRHFLEGVGVGDIEGLERADEQLTQFGRSNPVIQIAKTVRWANAAFSPPI